MARILRIDHIGLAVQDAEAARFWEALGLPRSGSETVPAEGVTVDFFPVGPSRIELLEPLGGEGPVQKFLTNRGEGIHHICFEVDDIRGLLAQLGAAGVELTSPEPRAGAEGSLVAFIHPRAAHGVLIELRQGGPSPAEGPRHDAG
jgi:methylmalonyl-CoA epimerase